MERIVEAGRIRAEVRFSIESRGFVRFDTDFIDGYDRKGQLIWQSGWADIAKARRLGASTIELEEKSGRKLQIPGNSFTSAAINWLLPSSAEVMQEIPDQPRRSWWVSVGLFALGAASIGLGQWAPAADAVAKVGQEALGTLVGVFILVGAVVSLSQRNKVGLAPVRTVLPTARDVWLLQGVLDEGVVWFRPALEPKRHKRPGPALIVGTMAALFLPFAVPIPQDVKLATGLGLSFIVLVSSWGIGIDRRRMRRAPEGWRLRMGGGRIFVLAGESGEAIEAHIHPQAQMLATAEVHGKKVEFGLQGFVWDQLADGPELPGAAQASKAFESAQISDS